MKFSKIIASIVLPLVMAGCASFPGTTYRLEELEKTTPTGTPFAQALAREYLAFSESERAQYSWFNSQHFAVKGLAAAHGAVVAPEELDDWSFSDKTAAQNLATARVRLVGLLASSAPGRVPALTATAQVKFDCWVEQQDKGWNKEGIEACRKDFFAAAEAIEGQAKAAPPAVEAPAAASAPVGVAAKPGNAGQFQVFFDFGKATLTAEADATLGDLVRAVKAAKYPKLEISGYTDLVGSDAVNARLSLRRADVVRKALIAAGVPADHLTVEGHGKSQPLVSTADGVKEPQNRRVVVRFLE